MGLVASNIVQKQCTCLSWSPWCKKWVHVYQAMRGSITLALLIAYCAIAISVIGSSTSSNYLIMCCHLICSLCKLKRLLVAAWNAPSCSASGHAMAGIQFRPLSAGAHIAPSSKARKVIGHREPWDDQGGRWLTFHLRLNHSIVLSDHTWKNESVIPVRAKRAELKLNVTVIKKYLGIRRWWWWWGRRRHTGLGVLRTTTYWYATLRIPSSAIQRRWFARRNPQRPRVASASNDWQRDKHCQPHRLQLRRIVGGRPSIWKKQAVWRHPIRQQAGWLRWVL